MRWNGRNYRPRPMGKQPVNPQPVSIGRGGLDTSKAKWVASYWSGPTEQPTPVETFYLETAQGDALQTAQGDNILWTT